MCLAVMAPKGKAHLIPMEYMAEAWESNPDGGGYAFITQQVTRNDRGQFTGYRPQIQVVKSLLKSEFLERLECDLAEHGHKSPFLIHFRWATHGSTNLSNVHPFVVPGSGGQTVVIHNGIIQIKQAAKDTRSDTRAYVETELAKIARQHVGWLNRSELHNKIAARIGSGSKLAFLTIDPSMKQSTFVVNKSAGHWKDGVWYSNYSYEPWRAPAKQVKIGRWLDDLPRVTKAVRMYWDSDKSIALPVPQTASNDDERYATWWMQQVPTTNHHRGGYECDCCSNLIPEDTYPWCPECWICNLCYGEIEQCKCWEVTPKIEVSFSRAVATIEEDRRLSKLIPEPKQLTATVTNIKQATNGSKRNKRNKRKDAPI